MSVNPARGDCPTENDITQLHREAVRKHADRQLLVLMTNDATLRLSCYSRCLSAFQVLLLDAIFFSFQINIHFYTYTLQFFSLVYMAPKGVSLQVPAPGAAPTFPHWLRDQGQGNIRFICSPAYDPE